MTRNCSRRRRSRHSRCRSRHSRCRSRHSRRGKRRFMGGGLSTASVVGIGLGVGVGSALIAAVSLALFDRDREGDPSSFFSDKISRQIVNINRDKFANVEEVDESTKQQHLANLQFDIDEAKRNKNEQRGVAYTTPTPEYAAAAARLEKAEIEYKMAKISYETGETNKSKLRHMAMTINP